MPGTSIHGDGRECAEVIRYRLTIGCEIQSLEIFKPHIESSELELFGCDS